MFPASYDPARWPVGEIQECNCFQNALESVYGIDGLGVKEGPLSVWLE